LAESKSNLAMNINCVFILFLTVSFSCSQKKIHGLVNAEMLVDGHAREYILYLPDSLPDNAPLVFVIHGFTDNASNMMNWTQMNIVADKNKFAVCYPQGLKDDQGRNFWEVGYDFTKNQHVDDVKFLTTLATQLQSKYKLSRDNTFAAGMSNGAEMCIVLGCKAPEVFKAVAPVCGCFMKSTFDAIRISKPVPVFMVNSTEDQTTSWAGDMENAQGWGAYLSVRTTFEFFVSQNACSQVAIDTLPDLNKEDSSYVISEKHSGGIGGNQVWLYTVVNGGHDWPGPSGNMDFKASEAVWEFFRLFITK